MHDIDRTQLEYGETAFEYGETGFEAYGETPLGEIINGAYEAPSYETSVDEQPVSAAKAATHSDRSE